MKFPEFRSNEYRPDTKLNSKLWVRNFLRLAMLFAIPSLIGVSPNSISVAAAQQQPAQGTAAQPPVAQAPANATPAADASKPTTPQTQQQKDLADDTAKLLILANELKAELDKSNKDTLSLGVIRKAEQVEKLAHKVRDEMKTILQN